MATDAQDKFPNRHVKIIETYAADKPNKKYEKIALELAHDAIRNDDPCDTWHGTDKVDLNLYTSDDDGTYHITLYPVHETKENGLTTDCLTTLFCAKIDIYTDNTKWQNGYLNKKQLVEICLEMTDMNNLPGGLYEKIYNNKVKNPDLEIYSYDNDNYFFKDAEKAGQYLAQNPQKLNTHQ